MYRIDTEKNLTYFLTN